MLPHETFELARDVLEALRGRGQTLTSAESCTGGLIAACLTDIPGSSDVVERSFVTYSNRAKVELLGVEAATIDAHGAVSEQTARAMAEGALARAGVDVAVAVTGIAGPGGGTAEKPVGLVHVAVARRDAATEHACHLFPSDRRGIRAASVEAALRLVLAVFAGDRLTA